MALASGFRLGPYEILAPVGAGGMGEVYRAKDTRLDRTVAIKVLPAHLSENPEVRQRFEREAKTISSLSHPHICGLYDVGREGGTDCLVMEFLVAADVLYKYEPSADGGRFLMNVDVAGDASAPLQLVVNWTAELARK